MFLFHPPGRCARGPPLKRGLFGFEGEEFVAVVFVLFAAKSDLSRQAALHVVEQGFKAVLSTPPCMHYPPPRFEICSTFVNPWRGPPLKRGLFGFEGEEFVAVVFVLFAAEDDLSRQAALEIVNQGFKAVLSTPPCMHYPPPRFELCSTFVNPWRGPPLKRGFEVEQFVAVVFVLFAAEGDLSRQAALHVVEQGFKAVLSTPPCMHYPPPRFELCSTFVNPWRGPPLKRGFEGEEFVAVVFVLFSAQGDLSRQATL